MGEEWAEAGLECWEIEASMDAWCRCCCGMCGTGSCLLSRITSTTYCFQYTQDIILLTQSQSQREREGEREGERECARASVRHVAG